MMDSRPRRRAAFARTGRMETPAFRLVAFLWAGLVLAGCAFTGDTPTATATITPTRTQLPTATPISTPSLVPDTGWKAIYPGLERRTVNLFDDGGAPVESLQLLRLDPQLYQLDVAYHPLPQDLEAWQKETGALVVVNGGYFRKENDIFLPDGLLVVNGETIGSSYGDFAGMLAITGRGPEVRWLKQTPYDPSEPLFAALQSFPLLVKPGGVIGFPERYEDNLPARRTVIGQDRQGRIMFIVAPEGYFTLHRLSVTLAGSDLDLDIALNLDGGPSTGWLVASPFEEIPSGTPLPIVITVQYRPH